MDGHEEGCVRSQNAYCVVEEYLTPQLLLLRSKQSYGQGPMVCNVQLSSSPL